MEAKIYPLKEGGKIIPNTRDNFATLISPWRRRRSRCSWNKSLRI